MGKKILVVNEDQPAPVVPPVAVLDQPAPAQIEETATNTLPPLIATDQGNGFGKCSLLWDTVLQRFEYRSIGARLSNNARYGSTDTSQVFTFDDETWVFGDDARLLGDGFVTAHTDVTRYTSGFYRRMFAATLWRAFSAIEGDQGVINPYVVSSIPAQEYLDGQAAAVRVLLSGFYSMTGLDGRVITVNVTPSQLHILSEGAGSYAQALADGDIASKVVAVIDVGYYTTDLLLFQAGRPIQGAAGSIKLGISQVADQVTRYLRRTYRYNGDVYSVDSVLDAGCIQIGNHCRGFSEQRDDAYADLFDDILRYYLSKRGDRVPAVVLLTGGRASSLYRCIPDSLLDESEWRVMGARSNVDGGLQWLIKKYERETGVKYVR